MIYLDTHVVVWLYQKDRSRFPPAALALIDREELSISPMVGLELEFLFEIDRIHERAEIILEYLRNRIELTICENLFSDIMKKAASMKWTRGPFDRIISAQAALHNSILITKDQRIRKHYPKASW